MLSHPQLIETTGWDAHNSPIRLRCGCMWYACGCVCREAHSTRGPQQSTGADESTPRQARAVAARQAMMGAMHLSAARRLRPRRPIRLLSTVAATRCAQPTPMTHPHLMSVGDVTPGLSAAEFRMRRANLARSLPSGSLALFPSSPVAYMSHGNAPQHGSPHAPMLFSCACRPQSHDGCAPHLRHPPLQTCPITRIFKTRTWCTCAASRSTLRCWRA